MGEALLAFNAAAIAAVVVAIYLRMRRSRVASDEIAALRKSVEIASLRGKVAALQQRIWKLEQGRGQSGEGALDVSCQQRVPAHSKMKLHQWRSISSADRSDTTALSGLLLSEEELAEAIDRLHALKFSLPVDAWVEEKYIAELHSIVDLLERESGADLSRFRNRSCNRSFLRPNILALLGFCLYQMDALQLPRGFIRTPRGASRRIH